MPNADDRLVANPPNIVPGTVSVVIPTFRRNAQLALLLDDLLAQTHPADQIVIVDNDAGGGAAAVVEAYRTRLPLIYEIQPVQNICLTRNRTVALATGEWVASIDDDERVVAGWLAALLAAAQRYGADGVMGPANGRVPDHAPAWLRKGSFYSRPPMTDGAVVPRNMLRFGNIMLRRDLFSRLLGPFDPNYGLTGGGDLLLLCQLAQQGARIVWGMHAVAWEPVELSRLSIRWLLLRGLRGGQNFADFWGKGFFGPVNTLRRVFFFSRAFAQLLVASALCLAWLPFSRTSAARWLISAAANFGKLSIWTDWRYNEYAVINDATTS